MWFEILGLVIGLIIGWNTASIEKYLRGKYQQRLFSKIPAEKREVAFNEVFQLIDGKKNTNKIIKEVTKKYE